MRAARVGKGKRGEKGRTRTCPVTHLLTQIVSEPEGTNDNHYHLCGQFFLLEFRRQRGVDRDLRAERLVYRAFVRHAKQVFTHVRRQFATQCNMPDQLV